MDDLLSGPDVEGPGSHAEPPLTEQEIREWLHHLAPSDTARATRIKELLRHAGEDDMSEADKVICHSCLRRLETKSHLKVVK